MTGCPMVFANCTYKGLTCKTVILPGVFEFEIFLLNHNHFSAVVNCGSTLGFQCTLNMCLCSANAKEVKGPLAVVSMLGWTRHVKDHGFSAWQQVITGKHDEYVPSLYS